MRIWYESKDDLVDDIERMLELGEESVTINISGMKVIVGDSTEMKDRIISLEGCAREAAHIIRGLQWYMDEIGKLISGKVTKKEKSDIEECLKEMGNDIEYAIAELDY